MAVTTGTRPRLRQRRPPSRTRRRLASNPWPRAPNRPAPPIRPRPPHRARPQPRRNVRSPPPLPQRRPPRSCPCRSARPSSPPPPPRAPRPPRHDHPLADPQGHHPRRSTPAAAAFRQRNLARGSGLGPRSRKARQASVADGIDRAHLQMADRRSRHRRFLVLRPAVGAGQTLLRGPCRRRLPTDERAPRPPPLIILLQEVRADPSARPFP